ncbi:MAG: hypothetical protein NZ516_00155 [Raineya sp.]|nr:hypothetical protein [Raineya sp.]
MKTCYYFGLFIGLWMQSLVVFSQEIIVKGTYQGKNVYIHNPLTNDQKNYCIQAVYLNGNLIVRNPRTSSFEVNLAAFSIGNSVEIKIVHSEGCKPKIINPWVLKGQGNFKFISFTADEKNLNWSVEGETANSVYYVERMVNNNWTNVTTIQAQNPQITNTYTYPITHNVGLNKYRIKHQERSGQITYSDILDYSFTQGMVKFYPRNVSNKIYFTADVSYEISNNKKEVVKKGKGKEVDVSNLPRGVYFISFDNRTEQFLKK